MMNQVRQGGGNDMSKIIILVGLPKSGKSTWTKKNKKEIDVIISADELRYMVYNQKFWTDGEPLMWSIRGIL